MKFLSFAAVCLLLVLPFTSKGQTKIVVRDSGNAFIVSDDNKLWGLEVAGKLVLEKKYTEIRSYEAGACYVVTAQNKKKGLCDASGKFIYPIEYYQITVYGQNVFLTASADAKPKIYSLANPKVEIHAQQMSMAQMVDQSAANKPKDYFDPLRTKQKRAIKLSQNLSDSLGTIGSYEIRDKFTGQTGNNYGEPFQELVVNGKVVFTATTFNNIVNIEEWERLGHCWYFIVSDRIQGRESYGLLSVRKSAGGSDAEVKLLIPLEYSFLARVENPEEDYCVSCTSHSGVRKLLNFWGGAPGTRTEPVTASANTKTYEVNLESKVQKGWVLKSVTLGQTYTELAMEYTEYSRNNQIYLARPGTPQVYNISIGGKLYPMQSSKGIGYNPPTPVNVGQTLKFTMTFPKLPEGTIKFDLIEGESGGWDILGVILK